MKEPQYCICHGVTVGACANTMLQKRSTGDQLKIVAYRLALVASALELEPKPAPDYKAIAKTVREVVRAIDKLIDS